MVFWIGIWFFAILVDVDMHVIILLQTSAHSLLTMHGKQEKKKQLIRKQDPAGCRVQLSQVQPGYHPSGC